MNVATGHQHDVGQGDDAHRWADAIGEFLEDHPEARAQLFPHAPVAVLSPPVVAGPPKEAGARSDG